MTSKANSDLVRRKNSSAVRIVVVGFGYWGPNIARNIVQSDRCQLIAICDSATDRQDAARASFAGVSVKGSLEEIDLSLFDAVVIATPASSHFELARFALLREKHVLVEKPLAPSLVQATELVKLADERDLILMVDHTFLFTQAVQQIRNEVDNGTFGDLVYFDSTRVNLGIFQRDVSVLWDLAIHDLSILDFLIGRTPTSVSATAGAHKNSQHSAVAALTLFFDQQFFAHISVSWLSPVKLRKTILSGSKRTVVFDDLSADEKLKYYDASVDREVSSEGQSVQLSYRLGDAYVPRLTAKEPLRTEIEHFCECIETGAEPIASGQSSLRIISVLEAAHESVTRNGGAVKVKSPV